MMNELINEFDNNYTDVYYVIRKWKNGNRGVTMKFVAEFPTVEEARQYCCSKLNIKYKPEKFDEDYKMVFWDSRKILFYFIV